MTMPLRVVLADDHELVRSGIKLLIELTDRYEVVGTAGTGTAAIERVRSLQPDLVVMDIRMPEMDGITATRKITQMNGDVRVLVLTAHDDPEYVEAVVQSGAMGCLSKRRAHTDLVAALDMLASGRMSFPTHVGKLLAGTQDLDKPPDALAELTEREREILYLTATGHTAPEIAPKVHLVAKTVSNYRAAIKKKLGAKTRVDLVRVVVDSGHLANMLEFAGIGATDESDAS